MTSSRKLFLLNVAITIGALVWMIAAPSIATYVVAAQIGLQAGIAIGLGFGYAGAREARRQVREELARNRERADQTIRHLADKAIAADAEDTAAFERSRIN